MKPFVRVEGIAVPLWRANVDTDAIIPIEYCVNRKRPHFDEGLFRRWRFLEDGTPKPFVLDDPRYGNPVVLVAGRNFGCGSSREMAVWALADHGIRCVVAPSFGEIFFTNCFQNGVLPIRLEEDAVEGLIQEIEGADAPRVCVDLEACELVSPLEQRHRFEVNELRRRALLEGLDPIAATLTREADIAAFHERDRQERPWIYHRSG